MKQRHHSNDSRVYPPGQSPVSDGSSVVYGDHRLVMKEIAKEQSLVTQLRAIVLPALQADERSELVAQMFQNILYCSSKAMAELQLLHQSHDARADDAPVDDTERLKRIPDDFNKEDVKPHHKHKRRRLADSVSLKTPIPHYDGRQWRKYGQKNINREKHPRSYYRCTYKQEQGCSATKTVQQDESISADQPQMYTVVYHGQHTCKGNNCSDSGTDDSETTTTMQRSSDSQSSISGNCSDPCDPERSLDGNKLTNKSVDLMAENMYEGFNMTSFSSLELDSWELDLLRKLVSGS